MTTKARQAAHKDPTTNEKEIKVKEFIRLNEDLDVFWIKIEGIEYGLTVDGDFLDSDGIKYDEPPFVVEINQVWEDERTEYIFEDGFTLTNSGGVITAIT